MALEMLGPHQVVLVRVVGPGAVAQERPSLLGTIVPVEVRGRVGARQRLDRWAL